MHEEHLDISTDITFPNISPEKTIGDYLESKLNQKVLKKYPQWDFPRLEPKLNLISASNDLFRAETHLEEKKTEALSRREQLNAEWQKLEGDGSKLKNTFQEFDKMITENSEKRERAMDKTKKEIIFKTNTEHAITDLQRDYEKLGKIRDEMDSQIKNHQIYEKFLQKVVEANPDEFKEVIDVYNKFGANDEARNSVTERLAQNIITLEDAKDKMTQQMLEQNSVLIGLNNRVSTLSGRYKAAKDKSEKWETITENIQLRLRAQFLEVLCVRKVCWSIYLDMCKRRKVKASIRRNDFEGQLRFIKTHLASLKTTIEIARNRIEADIGSIRVEKPTSPKR